MAFALQPLFSIRHAAFQAAAHENRGALKTLQPCRKRERNAAWKAALPIRSFAVEPESNHSSLF